MPNKLIINQNNSTIKADRLKRRSNEIIINAAPSAFNPEYDNDELLILPNCSNR